MFLGDFMSNDIYTVNLTLTYRDFSWFEGLNFNEGFLSGERTFLVVLFDLYEATDRDSRCIRLNQLFYFCF